MTSMILHSVVGFIFHRPMTMARTFAAHTSSHILEIDLSPPQEPRIVQDGSCREPFAHVPENLAGRRARGLDQRFSQNVGRQGAIFGIFDDLVDGSIFGIGNDLVDGSIFGR